MVAADDDAAAVRRWLEGDRRAGEQLIERHYLAVYRFFATKLPDDAEDLTQKTFQDIQRSIDTAPDRRIPNFRAYAMAIARNNLYMLLRSRATRERVFDPTAYSMTHMAPLPTPSLVAGRKREELLLLTALRRIPLEAQIALELYYWEELPVKEIAAILEVQPGTVMSRLARARDKLRAAMLAFADDPALVESTMTSLDSWARQVRHAFDG